MANCGDILSHGVLSRGLMVLFFGFHHTIDCDDISCFSRDAPMVACFLSLLFLSLAISIFLPLCLLSRPRQYAFPI